MAANVLGVHDTRFARLSVKRVLQTHTLLAPVEKLQIRSYVVLTKRMGTTSEAVVRDFFGEGVEPGTSRLSC
jgi:hypothetical protein